MGIYSNADPSLVYLTFKGGGAWVKDFTTSHPYQIGQIRLDRNTIDFPDVNAGDRPEITIGVVNLSDRPYEPVLMHLPPYLRMGKESQCAVEGVRKGTIKLTLDSKKLNDFGLTQSSVYLARFAGDKVSEENEIPVSAVLCPTSLKMSAQEKAKAPAIRLSQTEVDFVPHLLKKNKATHAVVITNTVNHLSPSASFKSLTRRWV